MLACVVIIPRHWDAFLRAHKSKMVEAPMAISGKQRVHSLHPGKPSYGRHEVFHVASHTYSNESAFPDMYLLVGVGKSDADCLGGVQLAKNISN